jgi:hypothetical protein
MKWHYMSVSYYNALENIINHSSAQNFKYEKWTQSAEGVLVWASLSIRILKLGVGKSSHWSEVQLECIEQTTRI